jgi:hypothetical protein
LVLLGLVVLAGAAAALAAQDAAPTSHWVAPNRRAAEIEARRLLADVVLPAGARRLTGAPDDHRPADDYFLHTPWVGAIFAAEVHRHAFWKTSASPSVVIASFQSHPPAGAKPGQSFTDGGADGAAFELGTRRRFVIGPQQLGVTAVRLRGGMTGVRVDAVVRYLSPRPASERVPAAVRLVQVTKARTGEKPSVSRVVTRHRLVLALARVVDSLPFAGRSPGSLGCPADNGVPTVTFVFRARPHGPQLAQLSELADTPVYPFSPCRLTSLTINGKRLPLLLDGGILLKRAGNLLGVTLTG